MSLTLGQFVTAVEDHARGRDAGAAWTTQQVKLALHSAGVELATEAAIRSSERMVFPGVLDVIQDEGAYELPSNVISVKGLKRIDTGSSKPVWYNRISYHAQDAAQSNQLYGHAGSQNPRVYWQKHRTLHVRPKPSTSSAASFHYDAFATPPMPERLNEELLYPPETYKWLFVRTALYLAPLPSPDVIETLGALFQVVDRSMKRWLSSASSDLPLPPVPDNILV